MPACPAPLQSVVSSQLQRAAPRPAGGALRPGRSAVETERANRSRQSRSRSFADPHPTTVNWDAWLELAITTDACVAPPRPSPNKWPSSSWSDVSAGLGRHACGSPDHGVGRGGGGGR
eukprot:scaffold5356_cov118-Isochrysis_galbana.AAC.7